MAARQKNCGRPPRDAMMGPMDDDTRKAAERKARGPRKVTAKSLENAALFYLERFATSAENLRRVLARRVERSARLHGTDPAEGALWIDALIAKFTGINLLDDALYAEARVRSLRRGGASRRAIALRLRQKGVDGDTIDAALTVADETAEEPEKAAAARLARKRRLGPYRPAETRRDNRERDLAALARAGFSYDVALAIIDAEGVEELEGEGAG